MDYSWQDSSVYGIFQARILEWIAISFSWGSSRPRDQTWVSYTAGGFFTNNLQNPTPNPRYGQIFMHKYLCRWGFPGGWLGKEFAVQGIQETQVRFLGLEDPLKEGMATHSSILGWRIPWTEEPGRLQSMGSQRVGHEWSDWAHACTFMHINI